MSDETQQARIEDALSAEESPLRDSGVEMITEFLLDRRVAELIDVEALVQVTLASLSEKNVTRVVAEHLSPAWDRHRVRSEAEKETVGDALPKKVKKELAVLAARTKPPPAAWSQGAVDPKLVRELVAPVLQNTLISFAQKLVASITNKSEDEVEDGSDDKRSGIAGRLRRGAQKRAEQIASVGKSVVGTIGAELDKRMSDTAKEFSTSAQRELRDAFKERLKSERGRELAAEIRRQLFARILETEVAVLMREVEALPRAELEKLVGPTVSHNAARAFFRSALESEIRAALDVEGDKTLRSLAEELEVVEESRAAIARTMDGLARELFGSRAFSAWLTDVLAT